MILLIHARPEEAETGAERLRSLGHVVQVHPFATAGLTAKAAGAEAVVISLERLPAHGLAVGTVLRRTKRTRTVPIVFAGGDPEKVARVKAALPDALYAEWPKMGAALKKALAGGGRDVVVPPDYMERWAHRPLWAKLGIREKKTVGLIGAPDGFAETLGDLPEGARLMEDPRGACDIWLWFVWSQESLLADLPYVDARAGGRPLWIAWPKLKTAKTRAQTGLSQFVVRKAALALGLVDYKICSIDAAWSAMVVTRKAVRKT
ncbi:MAG: hypothetical protein FJW40_09455 [Acidobacteria bacterium]|nr:hypothetical protein [Acidobacteriota bacterium]